MCLCWLGWKCVDSVHLCELIYMYCILLYCFCTLAYAFFFRDFFFFFSASPTQFLSFFALNLDLCACDTPRQNELKIADGSIHDWLTNSMLLLVCLLYKQIYFALQIIFCKRVVCVCVYRSIFECSFCQPINTILFFISVEGVYSHTPLETRSVFRLKFIQHTGIVSMIYYIVLFGRFNWFWRSGNFILILPSSAVIERKFI